MEVERKKNHQYFNSEYLWIVGGFGVHFYSFLCVYLFFFILCRYCVSLIQDSMIHHCATYFKETPGLVTSFMQLVLPSLPTQVALPPVNACLQGPLPLRSRMTSSEFLISLSHGFPIQKRSMVIVHTS